jgi:ribosomal protein S4
LITHRKIRVEDRIIDIPSYAVKINEENKITIKKKEKKEKPSEKLSEKAEEANVEEAQ